VEYSTAFDGKPISILDYPAADTVTDTMLNSTTWKSVPRRGCGALTRSGGRGFWCVEVNTAGDSAHPPASRLGKYEVIARLGKGGINIQMVSTSEIKIAVIIDGQDADRAMAENKAKPWIARMNPIGPTPFPTAPPHQTQSQSVKP
jgi:hypothetical protein